MGGEISVRRGNGVTATAGEPGSKRGEPGLAARLAHAHSENEPQGSVVTSRVQAVEVDPLRLLPLNVAIHRYVPPTSVGP